MPVSASQIRIEKSPFLKISPPQLTIFVPHGEKHTELTVPLCPLNVESHFPVLTFQIFTVLSKLPLAKDAPSGLQATDSTLRFDEMSQHVKQLDKRRKLEKLKKKNLTDLSARSTVTQFGCPFLSPKSEWKSPRFPLSISPAPHH
jgi:hypothetical protein